MAEGHGGRRTPRNPAPVSLPQSGARTDGGAGSRRQPLRVASGGGYGDRQAQIQQQQGAPLPVANEPSAMGGGAPQPAAPPVAGGGLPDLTAPTRRPDESPMAGAVVPNTEPDTQAILQALYNLYPSPWIGRLLRG